MDRGEGPVRARYVLPRHPSEVDRLDILHFATRAHLNGLNYIAPVRRPRRILDVGCGTGQWAYELCQEYPEAMVVGLDLVPSKPDPPSNYQFVQGNVLGGLPFTDGAFDFVHQRLLVSGIPERHWPRVVADLVRVTRTGGWIELVESMAHLEPEGPATRRLFDTLRALGNSAGLDTLDHVQPSLSQYLQGAGAKAVQVRTPALPIGSWGGQVGIWMACEYRALFTRLVDIFDRHFGLPEPECHELIATMVEEFEQLRPTITFKIAIGQRAS